jgi:precorrin-6B methylase 2
MKRVRAFLVAALALAGPSVAWGEPNPYAGTKMPKFDFAVDATPMPVVHAMLKLGKVGPGDLVVDLGCGDGRIPITAAKTYGAKAAGVDLNLDILAQARKNADKNGVADKVQFTEQDVFKTDIASATVVSAALWPTQHIQLRPMLLDKLAPGARVITNLYHLGDWKPDKKLRVRTSTPRGPDFYPVYLWIVPAKIEGNWKMRAGERVVDLQINRKYQYFSGMGSLDGKRRPVRNGRIEGTTVAFELALNGKSQRYTGQVQADGTIKGETWSAARN